MKCKAERKDFRRGGRRVGWRVGLEEHPLSGTNPELEEEDVEWEETEAGK